MLHNYSLITVAAVAPEIVSNTVKITLENYRTRDVSDEITEWFN